MASGSPARILATLLWAAIVAVACLSRHGVDSAPLAKEIDLNELPQAANEPFRLSWIEKLSRSFAYHTQEIALYQLNELASQESLDEMERGGDALIEQFIDFDMFGGAEAQEETFYQIQFYLQCLRVNVGDLRSMDHIWAEQGGVLERPQIVSLTNENATISIATARWNDLRTMDATEFSGYYQDILLSHWAVAFSQLQSLLDDLASKSSELCALSSDDERIGRIDDLWNGMMQRLEADSRETILKEKIWETMLSEFLSRYKELSFNNYFFERRFCADTVLENKLANCAVAESLSTPMPENGTEVQNTLSVINYDVGVVQDVEKDLAFAKLYLDIDQSILEDPRTECTFHYTIIASSLDPNSTQLYHQVCKYFGAGAQSLRPKLCCQPPDDQPAFCVPSATTQFSWNYIIVLALGPFALSPPPNPPPLGHQTRTLLFGLGGGIVHSTLLGLYPDMDITSVEISSEMVDVTFRHLHLHNQFCAVQRLRADGQLQDYEAEPLIDARRKAGAVKLRAHDQQCRSRLVLADGWKYLAWLQPNASSETASNQDRKYHYVMLDMFDATAITWNASRYEGKSNLVIDRPVEKFQMVREVLHEDYGVMAIHLHLDSQFLSYLAAVQAAFGKENTAVLDSGTTAAVVVASRSGFYRYSSHYLGRQAERKVEETCSAGSTDEAATGRNMCSEDKKLPHPCSAPETFGPRVAAYAEAWKYPLKVGMLTRHTLNCTNYP